MEQLNLSVSGMTCTGCENRVERTLKDLDGVRHVNADHQAGAVTLMLDEDQADEAAVRARIEQAGYQVQEAA
jgi:copper chaperone